MLNERLAKIHEQALNAAHSFRKAEAALIEALIAVEQEKVFVKLGYSSLFNYAVQSLKLSEGVAYAAIAVARKARPIPSLLEEIASGTIGISKAHKIASVLTKENQSEWLEKAKTLSSRGLEREVARVNPKQATPEKASHVSATRLNLQLGIEQEMMLKLRRAQDQVSQSLGKSASLEDTVGELVLFYLKHKDPVEKAKRVIARKGSQNPSTPVKTQFPGTVHVRTPIPAAIKNQVHLRDQHRCQHRRPDGKICGEIRWVDIHHIRHVSQGGGNDLENLITLCRAHHQHIHETRGPTAA